MQDLKFILKGQMIKKDPESPFSKMVAGTSNYYVAVFDMDTSWTGYSCLAHFIATGCSEYVPIVNGRATIPDNILAHKNFLVEVIGKNNKSVLKSNINRVVQIGGI